MCIYCTALDSMRLISLLDPMTIIVCSHTICGHMKPRKATSNDEVWMEYQA